jgi:hypothetical protein
VCGCHLTGRLQSSQFQLGKRMSCTQLSQGVFRSSKVRSDTFCIDFQVLHGIPLLYKCCVDAACLWLWPT